MCSGNIYYLIFLVDCHDLENLSTKLCCCPHGEEEGKEGGGREGWEVSVPGMISWFGWECNLGGR